MSDSESLPKTSREASSNSFTLHHQKKASYSSTGMAVAKLYISHAQSLIHGIGYTSSTSPASVNSLSFVCHVTKAESGKAKATWVECQHSNTSRPAPASRTKAIGNRPFFTALQHTARVPFVPSTKIALKFTQITNHEQWTLPISL